MNTGGPFNPATGDAMPLCFTTADADQTRRVGEAFGAVCRAGDVVALEGDLGAGKTQFVAGVAAGVGLSASAVSSPTFVLLNRYDGPGARIGVVHIDAYRLPEGSDLDEIGVDSAGMDDAVTLVEWSPRVKAWLHRTAGGDDLLCTVRIEHAGGDLRRISLSAPKSWIHRGGWSRLHLLTAALRGDTTCPITGKAVPADSPTWPFADEHARRADLGAWMLGKYRVSREATQDDLEGPVERERP